MSEQKHTPLPWLAEDDQISGDIHHLDSGVWVSTPVAKIDCRAPEADANARMIVAAVNSHAALLAACREMAADLVKHATLGLNESEVAMLRRAEAAIAKAEGQP